MSDLHGSVGKYRRLLSVIKDERPSFVFLGGDLLSHRGDDSFVQEYFASSLCSLRESLGSDYPNLFLILGNDDPRVHESLLLEGEASGLWRYIHNRKVCVGGHPIYGYCCVPPTPFSLKDWERYDVSQYCDPGCVSPEEGVRSVAVEEGDVKWGTIEKDLIALTNGDTLSDAVLLFHSPPYDTCLDRAALDGMFIDHVPLDPHVGSIAIRRFIEQRQPLITLHGHVHEAARLTGKWKVKIGRTHCLGAAHDGPELALVRFDPCAPETATRELLTC
ncbi:MAG TPA: metallophosphoesterase [Terriglobales bacterium]